MVREPFQGFNESNMHILVSLATEPTKVIPLWAALTDAHRAIPGLQVTLIGAESITACIRPHPAVSGCITVDAADWARPFWHPQAWRARRQLKSALGTVLTEPNTVWIDPFGTAMTRTMMRKQAGRRVGVSNLQNARLNRDYTSVFPLPPELHPVQAIRVLFAAELGYSLHNLEPDYGIVVLDPEIADAVDMIVDARGLPWTEEEFDRLKIRLSETPLNVAYLTYSDQDEAAQLLAYWPKIANARYVLAGLNSTAWLAAATGRPGLCICPPEQATAQGVISTHWASQKIINVDHPPFDQPHIVVESIIQVLQRQQTDA